MSDALNKEALPFDQHHDVVLAAWEGPEEEDRRPAVWEVSTGQERREYTARRLLSPNDADTIVNARKQTGMFPIFFLSCSPLNKYQHFGGDLGKQNYLSPDPLIPAK